MAETLHIYGQDVSQPFRTIVIFCQLSKIPFEHHLVDLVKGDYLSEEYKNMFPNQQVPAIRHGDFCLEESAAILAYLADAYNVDNHWYPKNIQTRGRINAYLHWHHQGLRAICKKYLFVKHVAPAYLGAPPLSEEKDQEFRLLYEDTLKTLTWVLSETHYVARTNGPTIADVFAYNEILNSLLLGVGLNNYPEIKNWFDEIERVPFVLENCRTLKELIRIAFPDT